MNVAIIKAGGLGTRAKQHIPKQFVKINGKPLIVHTLECFEKCDEIDVVVVSVTTGYEEDIEAFKKEYNLSKVKYIVTGGRSGLESIQKAYEAISFMSDDTVVIVHEANRPILTQRELKEGIAKTRENKKFGMSYRMVSENIVGYIGYDGGIKCSDYYAGFAVFVHPEYIPMEKLRKIIVDIDENFLVKKSSLDQLMEIDEINNSDTNMILSSFNNMKVTYPDDFEIVSKFLV